MKPAARGAKGRNPVAALANDTSFMAMLVVAEELSSIDYTMS
jgi:hypothetical protein